MSGKEKKNDVLDIDRLSAFFGSVIPLSSSVIEFSNGIKKTGQGLMVQIRAAKGDLTRTIKGLSLRDMLKEYAVAVIEVKTPVFGACAMLAMIGETVPDLNPVALTHEDMQYSTWSDVAKAIAEAVPGKRGRKSNGITEDETGLD